MAQLLTGTRIYGTGTVDTQLFVNGTNSATSTTTGALQVVGGVGIGGKLYVGDTINGNLADGSTGAIVYQSNSNITAFLSIGSNGQILQSNGSAPVWIPLSGVSAGSATTATHLSGGVAGQIPYQTAPGVTAFLSTGTAGDVLVSNGSSAPTYNNTLTLRGTTAATSTATGALVVAGGVGIGQSLFVQENIVQVGETHSTLATTYNLINTTATTVNFAGAATSLNVGATSGSTNVRNNLTVSGNLTVQGTTTIVDSTVTNIADPIITLGGGTGNTAPTADDNKDRGVAFKWVNNSGTTSTGFFGYDDSTGYLTYVPTATITNEVVSGTKGAMDVNLAGGTEMSIHYQSAADTTAFLAAGSSGYLLQTNGTGSAPTWVSASGVSAGSATNADNIRTIAQTASASYYPTFVDSNNASNAYESLYTTGTFVINPATGYIGMGTASPGRPLHVVSIGTATQGIAAFEANSSGLVIQTNSGQNGNVELVGYKQTSSTYHNILLRGSSSGLLVQNTTGNVGIGNLTPIAKLHIGAEDEPNMSSQSLFVQGSKTGYAGFKGLPQGQLLIYDDTASTAGSGGTIGFGANTGASQRTWIASINSERDSATNDATNYGGSLAFYTRPAQSTPLERMRIISTGTVVINPGGSNQIGPMLDIYGGGYSTYGALRLGDGSVGAHTNWWDIGRENNYTGDFTFALNGTEKLRITTAGGITFGTASGYGSSGQVLKSNGNAAPTWVDPSTLASASATNADNIKTVRQNASASYYPAFVSANNGTAAYMPVYTTSSFIINPFNGSITQGGTVITADTVGASKTPISFVDNTTNKNHRLDVVHYREVVGSDTTGTYDLIGRYGGTGGSPTLQGFVKLRDSSALLYSLAKHPVVFGPDASTSDIVGIDYYGRLHVGVNVGGTTPTRTVNITASTPSIGFIDGTSGLVATSKYAYIDATSSNLVFVADSLGQVASSVISFAVDGTTVALKINASGTSVNAATNGTAVITGGLGVSGGGYFGGIVTATQFVGTFAGSISGASTQVNVIEQPASGTYYPAFVDSNNATALAETVYTTSSFSINPSTGNIQIGMTGQDYQPSSGGSHTLRLNAANTSSIGFHDSGSTIASIKFSGNYGFEIGAYDGVYGPHNTILHGSVGIGTQSPGAKLEVYVSRTASTNAVALLLNDNVTGVQTNGVYKSIRSISNSGNSVSEIRFIETDGGNNNTGIAFATAPTAGGLTERMRVGPDGNVGIGIVATERFHVFGTANGAATQGPRINLQYSGTSGAAESLLQFLDFRGVVNASMGSNLLDDGVGTAAAAMVFKTATAGTLTERLRITRNGGISFGASGTAYGTSGQVLQSNGDAAPTWVAQSTIAAGSASLTNTYVGYGSASNLLTGSANLTWNGSTLSANGSINAATSQLNSFNAQVIGILGVPNLGTYVGYLLLAKAYISGLQSSSSVNGEFAIKRGGVSSGNRAEIYRVSSNSGYNTEGFVVQVTSGSGIGDGFFVSTVKVTYSGIVYHAIRTTVGGGNPDNGIVFYGSSYNAGMLYVDATYISAESSFGSHTFLNSAGNFGIGTPIPSGKLHLYQTAGGANQLTLDTNFASGNAYAINPFITSVSNGGFSIRDVTNSVERLVIQYSTGNVGIGTTAPDSKLHVEVANATAYTPANTLVSGQTARISNTDGTSGVSANLLFVAKGAGGGNGLGSISGVNTGVGSLAFTFGTRHSSGNVTERMRITSDGNVGIGTSNPTNKFEVAGTAGQLFSVSDSFTGTIFSVNDVSGIPSIEVLDTGLVKLAQYGGQVAINTGTVASSTASLSVYGMIQTMGTLGEIRASSEITAYFSSDRRLKENIKLIENPITIIDQIRGVTFDWTDEHMARRGGEDGYFVRKHDIGVIAQEVQAVLPELVGTREDGYLAVKYEKMVPLLIEAIKSQQKTIDTLTSEIKEIKEFLSSLKNN